MAWTANRTWVAGEVVTAAIMNAHVRDDFAFLATFLSTGTLGTRSILVGSGTAPIAAIGPLGIGDIVVGSGAAAVPTAVSAFTGTIGSLFLKSSFGGLNANMATAVKGGIPVGSATGDFMVKVVGSDGQILKADSTQAGGVKWANEQVLNLIVSGSGSGAASTAFATGTVSGMSQFDMLVVYYEIRPKTGSSDALFLMQGTSSATLMPLLATAVLGNGSIAVGQVTIRMLATGTESFAQLTEIRGNTGTYLVGAGTNVTGYHQVALPVAWTGSFTISLFAVGSATLDYRWRVYKQPGT